MALEVVAQWFTSTVKTRYAQSGEHAREGMARIHAPPALFRYGRMLRPETVNLFAIAVGIFLGLICPATRPSLVPVS
jgi:hypothetical protein